MASSLNLSLTDELKKYVDSRASDKDVYSTPSEYVRDLIRRDMQDWGVVQDIVSGLREARDGNFVDETILDILNEK